MFFSENSIHKISCYKLDRKREFLLISSLLIYMCKIGENNTILTVWTEYHIFLTDKYTDILIPFSGITFDVKGISNMMPTITNEWFLNVNMTIIHSHKTPCI